MLGLTRSLGRPEIVGVWSNRMLAALALLGAAAAPGFLLNAAPTVPVDNGRTAKLIGAGPPVVFSPGLLGLASWRFYTAFVDQLKPNVTVVVMPGPISASDVEAAADAIGAETVGFVSHSALDANILESGRVRRSVVCDPICLPWSKSEVVVAHPTLEVRASMLYNDQLLPRFNQVQLSGAKVMREAYGVGHADLLDDAWAELAAQTRLWSAVQPPRASFGDWSAANARTGVRDARAGRKAYRLALAKRVAEFMLDDARPRRETIKRADAEVCD